MKTEKLRELLAQMSLDEKIGELNQLTAAYFDMDNLTGPAAQQGLTANDVYVSGSCLSVTGAAQIRAIQEQHIKNHPHHIPMLFMADIINGYHTVFPIPLAQGATFDPLLSQDCAAIAAKEAAAAGLHVTFSPMADLVQDARWGRVMESTGEDPYLNGLFAAAMVKGYQGEDGDVGKPGKIAACLKHFAGYGAPQGGRDYNAVELSHRTLREDYLPAYQAAIDAGCEMVMTSFNTLDRIPSSANRWLMREVLRREMGFDGVVISDWAAVQELVVHGIAQDDAQAAQLSIEAGVDIDMVTNIYLKQLKKLVLEGIVPESLIDEAALRVLTLKNKLGLFENPFKDASEEDEKKLILCPEHRAAARDCAVHSFVLLKNQDQMLPLSPEENIAVIGPYVDHYQINGAWSFFSDDKQSVTLRQGMNHLFPQNRIRFAPGCPLVDPGVKIHGFIRPAVMAAIDPERALDEAIELAKTADKVILALGEPRDFTGECASRGNITLPECQLKLFSRICEVNPHVCVVLFNGRPLDLRSIEQGSRAILDVWMPGTEGGNAIAEVLFGKAAPSGKLPMSFPYCVGQVPVYYNHLNTGRPLLHDYREGRFASQYLDIPNTPLFPFVFGLTYTSFECSQITLDRDQLIPGQAIHASVQIRNTGKVPGTETVQLYIRDMAASVARPVRSLKGFKKVTLNPGENATVSFTITEEMLRFYDINMNYVSEPGKFQLFIGFDSTAVNQADFTLL